MADDTACRRVQFVVWLKKNHATLLTVNVTRCIIVSTVGARPCARERPVAGPGGHLDRPFLSAHHYRKLEFHLGVNEFNGNEVQVFCGLFRLRLFRAAFAAEFT